MFKIKLIGFDSMGTRGMATVIETNTYKLFIDPGVSYAPYRYGLPPHPVELEALEKYLSEIHREAIDSDIFIISHYHRDHYLYRNSEIDYYRGKILFIKNPLNKINYSQRIRAHVLLNKYSIRNLVKEIHIADSFKYIIDKELEIVFSPPVPHGVENTKLGYVIMTLVKTNSYKILHASDVQGPIVNETTELIINYKPDLLIISGVPTYFEGFRFREKDIENGLKNLEYIVSNLKPGSVIIADHHLIRDLGYRDRIKSIVEKGLKNNIRVVTAAEYMGYEVKPLEAMRRILWKGENQ